MNKFAILGIMAGVIVLGLSEANIAMAQGGLYGGGVGTDITATPQQLEECKKLQIPEFACTQTAILAKRRIINAEQQGAYGSGTPMLGRTFGELGGYVAALGAIFGGISAAFFAMALRKPKASQKA